MTDSGRLADTADEQAIRLCIQDVAGGDDPNQVADYLIATFFTLARRTEAETKAEAIREAADVIAALNYHDAMTDRQYGYDAGLDEAALQLRQLAASLLAQPEEPEVEHDPDCGKANGRGDGCICVELRAIRALAQPETELQANAKSGLDLKLTCALCGHEPHNARTGYHGGRANFDWLCHEDDHSCYHRWTVYGDRPAPAGAVVPETQQP